MTKYVVINGMSIRTTKEQLALPLFYVSSQTDPTSEYAVKTRNSRFIGKSEFLCSCPDFLFHRWTRHEDCKHIEAVKVLTAALESMLRASRVLVDIGGASALLAAKLRAL